ncbi:hypothetical protein N7478_007976 [Penicillium angulare]|uniref:uncharacterized protein n=1 Tax=Penicillium angulare TaxID=116970 RepID=UPI0025407652|nr:uncharacterized protein N7478_007976 [Penicillium angulare]KAJ5272851.1 hypothetical protein N7478_007976 [Penicillium angulare]
MDLGPFTGERDWPATIHPNPKVSQTLALQYAIGMCCSRPFCVYRLYRLGCTLFKSTCSRSKVPLSDKC